MVKKLMMMTEAWYLKIKFETKSSWHFFFSSIKASIRETEVDSDEGYHFSLGILAIFSLKEIF